MLGQRLVLDDRKTFEKQGWPSAVKSRLRETLVCCRALRISRGVPQQTPSPSLRSRPGIPPAVLIPTCRLHHRHDTRPDRLGQCRPSLDHRPQISVDRARIGTNCAGKCASLRFGFP